MLGGLDNVSAGPQRLLLSVSQEIRLLNRLQTGHRRLDDSTRQRRMLSTLLEAGYGVHRWFSLSILAGFVRQDRWIRANDGTRTHATGQGLADTVILPKLHILRATVTRQNDLAIGTGLKLPTGRYTLRENGLLIAPELQPGSGSWDPIFWGVYSRSFLPSPWTVVVAASARIPTENPRGYRFGPETLSSAGVSYGTAVGLDTSLMLRLRTTGPDRFQGDTLPNTGSRQLFAVPALNLVRFRPWTFRAAVQVPLWRDVSGTQLAETTTITLSIATDFSPRPDKSRKRRIP